MKTTFKSVAHLYKGVLMQTQIGVFPLICRHNDEWMLDCIEYGAKAVEQDIKPILRPLSDMNALEDREAIRLRMHGETGLHGAAESIRFMLSKHFDLFNLIENSEAIDSTTLKTNPYE